MLRFDLLKHKGHAPLLNLFLERVLHTPTSVSFHQYYKFLRIWHGPSFQFTGPGSASFSDWARLERSWTVLDLGRDLLYVLGLNHRWAASPWAKADLEEPAILKSI